MKRSFLGVLALTFCLATLSFSCKGEDKKQDKVEQSIKDLPTNAIYVLVHDKHGQDHPDNYVQVEVVLSGQDKQTANIVVSSPADNFQTSCSLQTQAKKISPTHYQATINDIKVNFFFEKDMLTIDTVNEGDRGVLSEFCAPGATLYGNYKLYAEN
ncbi:hypothetical protein [Myroides sp. LJL110]